MAGTHIDPELKASGTTKIVGRDENFAADVIEEQGVSKLAVKSSGIPEALGDLFFLQAENNGSSEMAVNANGSPVTFSVLAESGLGAKDLVCRELRFHGFDNGVVPTKFMGLNGSLSTGVTVRITSDGNTTTFLPIKITADFDAHFAYGDGGKYRVDVSAGGDYLTATFSPRNPFILRKDSADKVEIIINDNLSQVSTLELVVFGFKA
jgi:hypothetical protein